MGLYQALTFTPIQIVMGPLHVRHRIDHGEDMCSLGCCVELGNIVITTQQCSQDYIGFTQIIGVWAHHQYDSATQRPTRPCRQLWNPSVSRVEPRGGHMYHGMRFWPIIVLPPCDNFALYSLTMWAQKVNHTLQWDGGFLC